MNGHAPSGIEWTSARWIAALLGVMVLQAGFIFALGERKSPEQRNADPVQSLQLTAARTEMQELLDPTLFARPHAREFSAERWLRPVAVSYPPFRWNELARPLTLDPHSLGNLLGQFLSTNAPNASFFDARPSPEILVRQVDEIPEVVLSHSSLTILGALSSRKLLNQPELAAFSSADLLTNSIVQVLVDASGRIYSAVMLGAERVGGGSGSLEADSAAMNIARGLRFNPLVDVDWLSSPASSLTPGVLVFQWRTQAATNGANHGAKSP